MKLIDLLVQELPKRGGWPNGVAVITGNSWGNLYLWKECNPSFSVGGWQHASGNGLKDFWCGSLSMSAADDYASAIVTREQYEASLAASQQPVWNGEGLPPVGCEFEYGTHRTKAKCIAIGHHMIFASKGDPDDEDGDFEEFMISIMHSEFHPIRSESDKKRDEVIESLKYYMSAVDASDLYDALVAGEVKGVKLDV